MSERLMHPDTQEAAEHLRDILFRPGLPDTIYTQLAAELVTLYGATDAEQALYAVIYALRPGEFADLEAEARDPDPDSTRTQDGLREGCRRCGTEDTGRFSGGEVCDDCVDTAMTAYHEAYHAVWRPGGDAADHDEAHRDGVLAVLEFARGGDRPPLRRAVVTIPERIDLDDAVRQIGAYMPANYRVAGWVRPNALPSGQGLVAIEGRDHAGWTLDGYVIPRLASGLWACEELTDDA